MAKLISLLLLDDKTDAPIKCTIKGRSGIIFKIPRKALNESKEHDELKQDGIYFLLDKKKGRKKIYIGQASSRKNDNGVLGCLNEHDRKKDFWTEAIVFTTSDNSFASTELNWLENKFYNMAIDAARYEVTNDNEPPPVNVSEEKENKLEEQIEFVQIILKAIGYKIGSSQKKFSYSLSTVDDKEIFYLSHPIKRLGRTIKAQMKLTSTGYKVLAGSEISPYGAVYLTNKTKKRRELEKAKIVDDKLIEDIEFSSPSPAAEFLTGMTANGLVEWKTKDGIELKNFLQ